MKSLRYLLQLIVILISFSSCEKEIMTYSGQDGLYFDVRWGMDAREGHWAHQYYTPIEFGNMNADSYEAHLRVTASGEIKNYDRPFTITIGKDSTNAIEGEDYEPFSKEYVLKAGEQYAYIDITFNRTERMKNDTITLQLLLQPNEYFNCPFTNYGDAPSYDYPETKYGYNMDATAHKIVANDVMSMPEGWWGDAQGTGGGIFGKFSAKKWRLMMELTGTTIDDYTDEKMPSARANVIGEQLGRYLLEQAAKGREYAVIDEDGTMMWCMALQTLDPVNAWAEFTKPDDYYRGKN